MANETLGASFEIDTTKLKAGLAQANRLIRESESEFKAAAAGMDDWRNESEGLEAKIGSLNNITDIQRKKVNALQSEYDRLIAEGLDPASKKATELRTKINNETAALNKNEAEAKKLTEALEDLKNGGEEAADGIEEAGDAAKESSEGFTVLKGAAADLVANGISALVGAIGNAISGFFGLAESTREARTNMAKLETAFASAGLSAEDAENTFNELYGILGDDGAATETAQQLAKMSKDEADLAANTRILTGVMAEYGESIPTNSLAEGMAATAAMGEVQGTLADALEWQGVNLEEYNAQLAKLATEEERAAYIQSTLSDLYGESADAYMKNNASIIEAQKAQAEYNAVLNDMGAALEPVMTALKQMSTATLTALNPFVALIGEGLAGALSGTAGAADTLADGLGGVVNTVLTKAAQLLPDLIQMTATIIPKIVTTILAQTPMILSTLISAAGQILESVSGMLPSIVESIMIVLPMLVKSLISAIPQLLQAAISLLGAIVKAIPVIIVELVSALPSIIDSIISTILSAIPMLLNAAITLLMAIVDSFPVIVEAITENLPLIIESIITGLLDALPLLLDAAITLLFALIDAIPVIVAELARALPKIITAILSAIKNALPKLFETAKSLFGKILDAVADLVQQLPAKMGEIIDSIVSGLKAGIASVKEIGSDIIRGLWNGIKDMGSWIAGKIKGFGEDVLGSLKDFFGIQSPSKVMADEVGKNLALGIGEGFENNIADVNKQITGAMNFEGSAGVVGVNGSRAAGGVVVHQNNYYAQAHSRVELYKTRQATAAAVRLALGSVTA